MFFFCGSAVAIDWSREGEFLIDTNVVNLNGQYAPAAAFDGTNYLVVWEDDRNGDWDIYGARVDQSGNVIDPIAIPISTAASHQNNPSICFSGADYLVVWEDKRNDSLGDIYGARVNQAGVVLDPAGIALATADSTQMDPSLAFGGTNYLVTWTHVYSPYPYWYTGDIYAARVNQNGSVLDTAAIKINTSMYDYSPSVVYDGVKYFVVFTDFFPAPPGYWAIVGRFVTPTGDTLPATTWVAGAGLSYRTDEPSIAFDGTNYLVVYRFRDGWDIHGKRVDQTGNVLDSLPILIEQGAGKQERSSVAFDGLNYCVVWQDSCSDSTSWDICGAALNTSGIVIESFDVSIQPDSQITPTLAHGPGNQMLITYSGWTDSIGGNPVNRMRVWGKFYPFVGVEEGEASVVKQDKLTASIFRGPLQLPEGKTCKVFDITGRIVEPGRIAPGIYFLEVDGKVVQKVIKLK